MSIESMMPYNHRILLFPFLLLPSIFPSIRVFSNELALCIRWPKCWSFSFSISPSNEYSWLTSFRIDWFGLLAVQSTLKSLLNCDVGEGSWEYQRVLHSAQHFYARSATTAAAAKSLQLCLTLCDPIEGSLPGSPVPGILQARTLEWVAISFSSGWKWKVKVKSLSRVRLLASAWTAAHQAPPSMGFSRQEYWSGVPSPSPFKKLELFI